MALSAGANITGLNHTLQQLIAQLALYKLQAGKSQGKSLTQKQRIPSLIVYTIITGKEQCEKMLI